MEKLESKTKKMSLANIEGKLTPEEMENVMAGSSSCRLIADGLGGAALIFGAASWWTGAGAGFSLGLAAVSYGVSLAC